MRTDFEDRPEPKKQYRFQPFPAIRYHQDGSRRLVKNEDEDAAAKAAGYGKTPPPPPEPVASADDPSVAIAELTTRVSNLESLVEQLIAKVKLKPKE